MTYARIEVSGHMPGRLLCRWHPHTRRHIPGCRMYIAMYVLLDGGIEVQNAACLSSLHLQHKVLTVAQWPPWDLLLCIGV